MTYESKAESRELTRRGAANLAALALFAVGMAMGALGIVGSYLDFSNTLTSVIWGVGLWAVAVAGMITISRERR